MDNVRGVLELLREEMIKVQWKADGACVLYDSQTGCVRYGSRPMECSTLFCRNTLPLEAMYRRERLNRAHLFRGKPNLLRMVAEHEEACSCERLAGLVAREREGDAQAGRSALEMLKDDKQFRAMVSQARPEASAALDLLLGRSLETIHPLLKIFYASK